MKSRQAFLIIAILAGLMFACQFTGGRAVASPGDYELSVQHNGLERRYNLHLPTGYDGETPLPLVIVLHGGGGNGDQIARHIGMDELADEMGFAVAYPFGSGQTELILTWNTGHCCGYALENDVDDVGFLSAMIGALLDDYALDPQRVYLTGISNGGMMAYRAAAELSEEIAGIASIAGAIGGQAKEDEPLYLIPRPKEPVPVMIFHGQQDQNVLYDGGHGQKTTGTRVDMSVAQAIAFWVETNGCSPEPQTTVSENGSIITDSYTGCDQGADVVLITIVDGGHAWPGAEPGRPGGDVPTQDISANEMMLEFFLAHPND